MTRPGHSDAHATPNDSGERSARPSASHDAVTLALPLLRQAVVEVPLPPVASAGPFTMADYGAGLGRNSLAAVHAVIAAVRARAARPLPILVAHTDLPGNDFTSLFELLASSPDSYLAGNIDVYAAAVGRSQYEQVLPPATVALGYAALATHRLSAAPCTIADSVWTINARGSAHDAFAARARQDWRHFLSARARELQPGGRLVVIEGGRDRDGRVGAENSMNALDRALRGLVEDGTITAAEFDRMTVPTYYRTAEEVRLPFDHAGTGLPLRLIELTTTRAAEPPLDIQEQDGDTPGPAAGAAATIEAITEGTLTEALDPERDADARDHIATTLYTRLQQVLEAAPDPPEIAWTLHLMLIAKDT